MDLSHLLVIATRLSTCGASVSYDRMQATLKTFVYDQQCISGYLYKRLLGHDASEREVAQAMVTYGNGQGDDDGYEENLNCADELIDEYQAPNLPALNESQ